MTFILILFSSLIILTKFADCYTTANKINHEHNFEKNPLARFLMKRFGINSTIWIIFIITIFITIISLISVIESNSLDYEILFILIASLVSVVQFFVALHNHTKNPNFLTRILYRIFFTNR